MFLVSSLFFWFGFRAAD